MDYRQNEKGFRSGMITIIGWTNVGKSTLLNRILSRKIAITSEKPQTTRNRIVGIKNLESAQLVFTDTPGIHREKKKMNRYMSDVSLHASADADVILLMADASDAVSKRDRYIIESLPRMDEGSKPNKPVILALNKIDLVAKPALLPIIGEFQKIYPFAEIVPVSAEKGENIDRLLKAITPLLPEGPQYFPKDMVTDQPEEFYIAELIREKIFRRTKQEIPYSSAVAVESIEEKRDILVIHAVIYIETKSQKGIVIGHGGEMLKTIGTAAREDIERWFNIKVYLDLRVKVKERWTSDDRALRELVYFAAEK